MNLPNKITISRLIMSAIVLILLIVPMEKIGLDLPTVKVTEAIRVDVKYLIAGILFLIASVTDFIDSYSAVSAKEHYGLFLFYIGIVFNYCNCYAGK